LAYVEIEGQALWEKIQNIGYCEECDSNGQLYQQEEEQGGRGHAEDPFIATGKSSVQATVMGIMKNGRHDHLQIRRKFWESKRTESTYGECCGEIKAHNTGLQAP
jgi:hypothetical protein